MTDSQADTDINDEESTLDMDELASTVVDHIDPGQTIGDKIVLSRRQLLAIAGGGLSLGALGTFGVSDAEAQSAVGTIGTASSPVDVEAAQVNANQLDTASAVTEDLAIGGSGFLADGDVLVLAQTSISESSDVTTTSTSFRNIVNSDKARATIPIAPSNATLVARHFMAFDNSNNTDTTTASMLVLDSTGSVTRLTDLDITGTGTEFVDTGFVEPSNFPTGDTPVSIGFYQAKVSGGTGTLRFGNRHGILWGIQL